MFGCGDRSPPSSWLIMTKRVCGRFYGCSVMGNPGMTWLPSWWIQALVNVTGLVFFPSSPAQLSSCAIPESTRLTSYWLRHLQKEELSFLFSPHTFWAASHCPAGVPASDTKAGRHRDSTASPGPHTSSWNLTPGMESERRASQGEIRLL